MQKTRWTVWLWIMLSTGNGLAIADAQQDYAVGLETYESGNAVEAARWFGMAAEQGLAEAQLQLGSLYYKGQGVAQDFGQALYWFIQAAEHGNAEAQTNLGYIYDKAMAGVAQDYKKAVAWYRKAAEQGYANAQFDLGMMYYEGLGVLQDYIEAHKWLNLAASNGHPDAAASREHTEKRMTNAQIAEAQQRASEWQAAFDRAHF